MWRALWKTGIQFTFNSNAPQWKLLPDNNRTYNSLFKFILLVCVQSLQTTFYHPHAASFFRVYYMIRMLLDLFQGVGI